MNLASFQQNSSFLNPKISLKTLKIVELKKCFYFLTLLKTSWCFFIYQFSRFEIKSKDRTRISSHPPVKCAAQHPPPPTQSLQHERRQKDACVSRSHRDAACIHSHPLWQGGLHLHPPSESQTRPEPEKQTGTHLLALFVHRVRSWEETEQSVRRWGLKPTMRRSTEPKPHSWHQKGHVWTLFRSNLYDKLCII